MSNLRLAALAVLSYLALALVQTWPLALCLSTHLTGEIGGDAGVYVWNTWVFRHELVDLHRFPFSTDTVLPMDGPTNLGLHNYTVFSDLLALPLQPWLGVVRTFNVVFLINIALTGLGMFVLCRRLTARTAESWMAGAVFASAPFLVARGNSHYSLAAAAALPFFLYWLDRAWNNHRAYEAAAAGAMVAWAGYSNPYYAVYCVMLTVVYAAGRTVSVSRAPAMPGRVRGLGLIDLTIIVLVVLIGVVHWIAGGAIRVGPLSMAMRSLYTPMLLLALLVLARVILATRPVASYRPLPPHVFRTGLIMGGSAALLLAPELYAVAALAADGQLTRAPVLWRSSAPGVDLISFLLPNPTHPLTPEAITTWLAHQPGRFDENVVSISWVCLAVIVAARRLTGFAVDRMWLAVTLGFAWLALGPFVHVGGVMTYVPTPWTFLRYLPVIGDARMPQRFGVLVFLGFTVLFAEALVALNRQASSRRRWMAALVGCAIVAELLPAPRRLFAAGVPAVYQIVADDPRPVSVLDLPFGVRDGLSSIGDFSAASQFYQTLHGKTVVGGYLSRVETATKNAYLSQPTLRALMEFSEGRTPDADVLERATADATRFLTESHLGYVVIDTGRVSPDLRQFAVSTLGLREVASDGPHVLYAVESARR